MARIAWGIMGDARGHLTRALIMAGELSGHTFLFVGGGCVRELAALGHQVCEVPMPATLLAGDRVRTLATARHFLGLMTGYGGIRKRLVKALTDFRADYAFSDYEFFLPRAAKAMGLPSAGFDHQHVLTRCEADLPPGQALSRLLTLGAIRGLFSVPEKYLVTSFFPARPTGPDTTLLPPVLRPDVPVLTPAQGEHVVLYLRAGLRADVLAALAATGREVRAYGMGERPDMGRVRFLPTSRQGFLEDMASCAFVACNGGHNVTSEALHLGKPVLAFPTAMFYEQHVNAWHLRRLGFGDFVAGGDCPATAARAFEARLSERRENLRGRDFFGNRAAARAVERLLAGG